MVTDEQVRLLRRKRMEGKSQEAAAAAAGMSVRTGQKWLSAEALPSASKAPRSWRTREDPFEGVWDEEIVPLLERDDERVLQATTLIELLEGRHPGRFAAGQVRTLQRLRGAPRALSSENGFASLCSVRKFVIRSNQRAQ